MYSIKCQLIYDVFNRTIVNVFLLIQVIKDYKKLTKTLDYQLKKVKNKKLKKQEKQFNKSIHKIRIKIEYVFA